MLRDHRNSTSVFCTILILVVLATRVAIILLTPEEFGSYDLGNWLQVIGAMNEGRSPYTTGSIHYPPAIPQILFVLSRVCEVTGIPYAHGLKFLLTLNDAILSVVVFFSAHLILSARHALFVALAAVALGPAPILISVQHVQFDFMQGTLCALYVLFAARSFVAHNPLLWILACMALAGGILLKTVPILLLPTLLAGVRALGWKWTLLGGVIASFPFALGMSTVFLLDQGNFASQVVSYHGIPGFFGFSGLHHFWEGFGPLSAAVLDAFPYTLVAFGGLTAVYALRAGVLSIGDFARLAFLCMISPIALGPGYGPQYVGWFYPLAAVLYAFASRREKVALVFFFVILSGTMITEYALLPSHGSFLTSIFGMEKFSSISHQLFAAKSQSLLRGPYFISLLLFNVWYAGLFLYRSMKPLRSED